MISNFPFPFYLGSSTKNTLGKIIKKYLLIQSDMYPIFVVNDREFYSQSLDETSKPQLNKRSLDLVV